MYLRNLLRKDFCILDIKLKQGVFNALDISGYLLLCLEQVGVILQLIAQLGLQFIEIILIGLFEFFFYIDKIDYKPVTEGFVGPIDAGECLQKVVRLDNSAQV